MENALASLLFCPLPSTMHPEVAKAQTHTEEWARHMGLIVDKSGMKRIEGGKFASLIARAYPTAPYDILTLICDWTTWLFLLDDICDEGVAGTQPTQLSAVFAKVKTILTQPCTHITDEWQFAAGLADLWQRTRTYAQPEWTERFISQIETFARACVWESRNRQYGHSPDYAEYIAMRRVTQGLYIYLMFTELAGGYVLSETHLADSTLVRLTDLAGNVLGATNDILSLGKELETGDPHNLVLVLQHAHNQSLNDAIAQAIAFHDASMRSFIHLAHETERDLTHRDDLTCHYIAGMRSLIRGNLDWSVATRRYRVPLALLTARPAHVLAVAV